MLHTPTNKLKLDNVKGAILGSVVGDALGVPGEFLSRSELRRNPITDMIGGGVHEQLPGTWSDDTSMVLCTMDSMWVERSNRQSFASRNTLRRWNAATSRSSPAGMVR